MPPLHRRYLALLGVEPDRPGLAHLRRLVRAHLERVPFENISKLHHLRTRGLRDAPDLELFLDGVERHGFGGTCSSNNPHFAGLLRSLGYDVSLCGADMSDPDVHTALIVRLQEREYLVDTGYAAPLFEPLPRDRGGEVRSGDDRWVLDPPDGLGRSRMTHLRRGEPVHGYLLKPRPREPGFFRPMVRASFRPSATFMTQVLLVRVAGERVERIANLNLVEATGSRFRVTRLADRDELVTTVEERFGIPAAITREAIAGIDQLDDFRPD